MDKQKQIDSFLESEKQLLADANYLTSEYKLNTKLNTDLEVKLRQIKFSDIIKENENENIAKIIKEITKLFGICDFSFNFDFVNGVVIYIHLRNDRKYLESDNFRINGGKVKYNQFPFISIYFNYKHRTVSTKGVIGCKYRPKYKKNWWDMEFRFIEYAYAYSVESLFEKIKIDRELLNKFVK